MKKILLVLVSILFVISFASCKEQSQFEQFAEKIMKKYPDELILEDGWYSIHRGLHNYYYTEENRNKAYTTKSSVLDFRGEIKFNDDCYVEVGDSKLLYTETTTYCRESNKPEETTDIELTHKDGLYYRTEYGKENIVKHGLVYQETRLWYDPFLIGTFNAFFYNYVNQENTDAFDKFSVTVSLYKPFGFGAFTGIKITTDLSMFDSVTAYYIFDEELNITKILFENHWNGRYNQFTSDASLYLVLEKINKEEIDVPVNMGNYESLSFIDIDTCINSLEIFSYR